MVVIGGKDNDAYKFVYASECVRERARVSTHGGFQFNHMYLINAN